MVRTYQVVPMESKADVEQDNKSITTEIQLMQSKIVEVIHE